MAVHNPGALPQSQYFDPTISEEADLTVIFESSFSNWIEQGTALAEATTLYDPEKLALILHSTPNLTDSDMVSTLQQLFTVGHAIWMTGTISYTELDDVLFSFVANLAIVLECGQTLSD